MPRSRSCPSGYSNNLVAHSTSDINPAGGCASKSNTRTCANAHTTPNSHVYSCSDSTPSNPSTSAYFNPCPYSHTSADIHARAYAYAYAHANTNSYTHPDTYTAPTAAVERPFLCAAHRGGRHLDLSIGRSQS